MSSMLNFDPFWPNLRFFPFFPRRMPALLISSATPNDLIVLKLPERSEQRERMKKKKKRGEEMMGNGYHHLRSLPHSKTTSQTSRQTGKMRRKKGSSIKR